MSKFNIPDLDCVSRTATMEEIIKYRNESDPEKRLELIYEYHIPKEKMIEDDYFYL